MTKIITENELTLLIKQLDTEQLVVKSSNKQKVANDETDNSMKNGRIQVIDQQIIVHDPVDGGRWPLISSAAPVKLIINSLEVTSECTVSSTDHILWTFEEESLFEIHVSEDKLTAYFHLHSKRRHPWRLVHTEPQSTITITAEKDQNIVLEMVHLSNVVKTLELKGIKYNLNVASIQQELVNPTYKPVVIARGKAPTEGKDAQLEAYFSQQVESHFFEISGSVDFRNHLKIPSAKRGEVIAKKIFLVEGIPGYDVYGNTLLPAPPKDILVAAKSNVELTPDGDIIALKEGRPRITGVKLKTVDISTSYTVSGNVDIATGNIVFTGDVIVYGNVSDNMIIESLGNVYIYGSVYNSTITATGSIHIRGVVIGSKLYSGYFGVVFNRLYHASKNLSQQVEKLLVAATMLAQALESKKQTTRFGQIVLLLIENKFKDIPLLIKDLLIALSNIQLNKKEEHQKLKEISEVFFQSLKIVETASYSFLQGFFVMLQEMFQEVARMQEEHVEININQCHNSELKSNGDILIHHDGVLLSDLFSAGNITFKHEASVCRGSHLEAGGSIFAKTIGGQSDANTVLKAKKQVHIKKMYFGRVCVANYCMDIFNVIENKTFDMHNIKPPT